MWCESQKGMAKKSMVIVFSFQVLAVKKESSFDDADAAPAAGLGGCLPRPPPPPVDRGGRGGIQKTGHLEYNVQVAFLFKKTSNLFFFSEGEGKAATGGEGCGQGWKVPWVEWKFRDCSHIWESQELIFTCPYLCSVSISDNQVRTLWMCRMYYLDHCKCTYLHTMYLYMVVGGKKTRFWKKKSLRQKFLSSEKVIRTLILFFFAPPVSLTRPAVGPAPRTAPATRRPSARRWAGPTPGPVPPASGSAALVRACYLYTPHGFKLLYYDLSSYVYFDCHACQLCFSSLGEKKQFPGGNWEFNQCLMHVKKIWIHKVIMLEICQLFTDETSVYLDVLYLW